MFEKLFRKKGKDKEQLQTLISELGNKADKHSAYIAYLIKYKRHNTEACYLHHEAYHRNEAERWAAKRKRDFS